MSWIVLLKRIAENPKIKLSGTYKNFTFVSDEMCYYDAYFVYTGEEDDSVKL